MCSSRSIFTWTLSAIDLHMPGDHRKDFLAQNGDKIRAGGRAVHEPEAPADARGPPARFSVC